jgi:hypothetical protein
MNIIDLGGPIPVDVNPKDNSWALYIYDANGYHRGPQWFSRKIKYPDEEITIDAAHIRTIEAIANAQEVRVTDGGDFLVFHSIDGEILHGEKFWDTIRPAE